MLRYGTQKTVGYPSALNDTECRKRGAVSKITSLEGSGFDLACLPPHMASGLDRGDVGVAVLVPPFRAVNARTETRGARAPPSDIA